MLFLELILQRRLRGHGHLTGIADENHGAMGWQSLVPVLSVPLPSAGPGLPQGNNHGRIIAPLSTDFPELSCRPRVRAPN